MANDSPYDRFAIEYVTGRIDPKAVRLSGNAETLGPLRDAYERCATNLDSRFGDKAVDALERSVRAKYNKGGVGALSDPKGGTLRDRKMGIQEVHDNIVAMESFSKVSETMDKFEEKYCDPMAASAAKA